MQKRLNEDVIDFDVLEDLISYIDENYPPGAILVFLPVGYLESICICLINFFCNINLFSIPFFPLWLPTCDVLDRVLQK